jgi:hypothetical protein
MEAVCSSETSLNFYQTTWCHIPEDNILPEEIFAVFRNLKLQGSKSFIASFLLSPYLTAYSKSLERIWYGFGPYNIIHERVIQFSLELCQT